MAWAMVWAVAEAECMEFAMSSSYPLYLAVSGPNKSSAKLRQLLLLADPNSVVRLAFPIYTCKNAITSN